MKRELTPKRTPIKTETRETRQPNNPLLRDLIKNSNFAKDCLEEVQLHLQDRCLHVHHFHQWDQVGHHFLEEDHLMDRE